MPKMLDQIVSTDCPLSSAALRTELAKLRANLRQDVREEIQFALAGSSYDWRLAASAGKEPDDEMIGVGSSSYELSFWAYSDGQPPRCRRRSQRMSGEMYFDADASSPPDMMRIASICEEQVQGSPGYLLPPLSKTLSGNSRQDPELISVSTPLQPPSMLDLPGTVPDLGEGAHHSSVRISERKKRKVTIPRLKKALPFCGSATSRFSSRHGSTNRQGEIISMSSTSRTSRAISSVTAQDVADMVVAGTVVLNGIIFGLQTEEQAVNCTDAVSEFYVVAEAIFFVVLFTELVCRLIKHRLNFFVMPGCAWNWFDAFLVCLQVFDALFEVLFGSANSALGTATAMKNMGLLRLLRMLRLLRALRLVRLLQFFGELNVVTSAIVSSLQSLFGTVVLLLMIIYVMGIIFTQIATAHRVQLRLEDRPDDERLNYWWGSLSRAMLSLYQSILAGADWNDAVQPLMDMHVLLGVIFVFYIAFVLLAMMNVITGIFVESALKNADKLKKNSFAKNVRELYNISESEGEGRILKSEFAEYLQDETFQMYLEELGVELEDVRALLDFLDDSKTETIDVEQLLSGLLRLRAGSKFTDIMGVIREIKQQKLELSEWTTRMDFRIGELKNHLTKLGADAAKPIEPKSHCHVASPSPPLPCTGRQMLAPLPRRGLQCTEV